MKRKAYITPEAEVVQVPLQLLVIISDGEVTVKTGDEDDPGEDPNGSRRRGFWDDGYDD